MDLDPMEGSTSFNETRKQESPEKYLQREVPFWASVYSPTVNPLNGKVLGPNTSKYKGRVRVTKWGKGKATVQSALEVEPISEGDIACEIVPNNGASLITGPGDFRGVWKVLRRSATSDSASTSQNPGDAPSSTTKALGQIETVPSSVGTPTPEAITNDAASRNFKSPAGKTVASTDESTVTATSPQKTPAESEFDAIVKNVKDANLFNRNAREFAHSFDATWNALVALLKANGERIAKEDKKSGLIETELTLHKRALGWLKQGEKYVAQAREIGPNLTRVELLMTAYLDNGSPMHTSVVDDRVRRLFEKLDNKLKGK
jgi:hypothetical protein